MGSLLLLLSYLLFLLHLQASFSLNSSSSTLLCNHYQSFALLQFKKSFSVGSVPSTQDYHCELNYLYEHKPFPKTDSWKEGKDCCRWNGVTCDIKTGNVIGLDLSRNFLQGTITSNSTLFSLVHLQMLDLSYNDFKSSEILPQFGQFLNLRYLNLHLSNFVGQVPLEISNLYKLISLDLFGNVGLSLDAITFKKLAQNSTNLQKLDLSFVDMSSVAPSSLMNLSSSLSSLKLLRCGLLGKFPDIVHLSKLVALDLSDNDLTLESTYFYKIVQNLTQLQELSLSSINMSSIAPSSLMNLPSSLSSLTLSFCELRGKFADNIIQRPNLKVLDLWGNEDLAGPFPMSNWSPSLVELDLSHTKIPVYLQHEFFNNLKSLYRLGLRSCNFVGSNLALFGNLSQLTSLDLSYNNFSGQIPSFIGNLKQLNALYLLFNNFTGQIPSSFANLKLLVNLNIAGNNINGQIPNYFTNFTQFVFLNLSNNGFSGPIPSDVGRLSTLLSLDLSNNLLNGTIPSSLFALPLDELFLNNNSFMGPIGQFQYNRLSRLDLSNNKLYGPIPSSIFRLLDLTYLILSSNNKLTGEVSSEICKLKSLKILDLSNNSLSGPAPRCLGNFSYGLSVLHLGMNDFTGVIPETFLEGSNLRYLNFNGNKLQGRIPPSISNCKNLEVLDLGKNEIEDTFPYFLETLLELQILVLKSNKLHGLVEGNIANYSFSMIRVFDLSDNMFSGPLPVGYLNNFRAMMNVGNNMQYMSEENFSYYYSVSLIFKGLEREFVKIQTLVTTIDLSNNRFTGKIPQLIGKLKSLKYLNISQNHLTGNIEPSLGNLTNLESLDLSSNLLTGRIPMHLTDLTFLSVFRVSYNQLEGPIPEGKQFNTFDNTSYDGNLGLCGLPLQKECKNGESQQSTQSEEDDLKPENGFGWKAVLAGYGCGLVFGVATGFIVFTTRKPAWFVNMVEVEGHRKLKRVNKKVDRTNGRRNP